MNHRSTLGLLHVEHTLVGAANRICVQYKCLNPKGRSKEIFQNFIFTKLSVPFDNAYVGCPKLIINAAKTNANDNDVIAYSTPSESLCYLNSVIL